jgi:hypothetical protein
VLAAAVLSAVPLTHIHRIDLVDGGRILSLDLPTRSGTVVTFHRYPGGELSGVPAEMVERIEPARVASSLAGGIAVDSSAPPSREGKELEPGEVVVLTNPTGEGAPAPEATALASAPAPQMPIWNGYFYGGGSSLQNPNGTRLPPGTTIGTDGLLRVLSTTDLAASVTAAPLVGPNGFPVTPGATAVIGQDGTPILASDTGLTTMVIGPNGTPIPAGSGAQVIGNNGTPAVGAAPAFPVIGPNGTPILAPAGTPGSAFPTIGPNGTPNLAPSGQTGSSATATAPNGSPSSPPRSAAPTASTAASSGGSASH